MVVGHIDGICLSRLAGQNTIFFANPEQFPAGIVFVDHNLTCAFPKSHNIRAMK